MIELFLCHVIFFFFFFFFLMNHEKQFLNSCFDNVYCMYFTDDASQNNVKKCCRNGSIDFDVYINQTF